MSRNVKRQNRNRKKATLRPVFHIERDKPCMAGGVMFYRYTDECDMEFLMINVRNRYEDFGGKTDPRDTSIIDTIIREVDEESNGIFPKEFTRPKLQGHGLYLPDGKYLLYYVEIYERYDTECFGTMEATEKINRIVEWVPLKSLLSGEVRLHPRLQKNAFLTNVKNLTAYIGVPESLADLHVSDSYHSLTLSDDYYP